jgi:hypothetical protein
MPTIPAPDITARLRALHHLAVSSRHDSDAFAVHAAGLVRPNLDPRSTHFLLAELRDSLLSAAAIGSEPPIADDEPESAGARAAHHDRLSAALAGVRQFAWHLVIAGTPCPTCVGSTVLVEDIKAAIPGGVLCEDHSADAIVAKVRPSAAASTTRVVVIRTAVEAVASRG